VFLDTIYNNESYSDLILKDPKSGKKVIFLVGKPSPDPKVLKEIEFNGGRNDILIVQMWALLSPEDFQNGMWSFFSPCWKSGEMTTSIISNGTTCNQLMTVNSPMGSQMSVSPSFQLAYASLPFNAAGKFYGLSFKVQFYNAFRMQPDYLFISSWNEWISQPQQNPYSGKINTAFSMGLGEDPNGSLLYVDSYGSEWSRDIEPSRDELGDYYYRIMSSCLRVLRLGRRSCDLPTEECCRSPNSTQFKNLWSLKSTSASVTTIDFLLTDDLFEAQSLINRGLYKEECTPFYGSTVFCYDSNVTEAQTTSFLLFSSEESTIENVPGFRFSKTSLYRCLSSKNQHFLSEDSNCERKGSQEKLLGYVSRVKQGMTLRELRRCFNGSYYYHSLDYPCNETDQENLLMGYVV